MSGLRGHVGLLLAHGAGTAWPLDGLDTTNIWNAFGVEKRLLAGSGPLFRIVSSAAGNPFFDITGDTFAQLSAACASALGSNSGYISTLYDHAGGATVMQQATFSKMPQAYSSGLGFFGKMTFQATASQSMSTSVNTPTSTAFHAFMKGKRISGFTAVQLEQNSADTSNDSVLFLDGSIGKMTMIMTESASGATRINRFATGVQWGSGVIDLLWDRSQTSAALACQLGLGGSVQTTGDTTGSNATAFSGGHTAAPFFLGGRNNASFFSDMECTNLVIWKVNEVAIRSSIATALA